MSSTTSTKKQMSGNLRQSGIFIAFVLIVVLFSFLHETFLSAGNLTNIVLQYSYILILAIGMLFVIVLGQIDLSVGSVVAVTCAVAAVLVVKQGFPWWVGVIAALITGALIGAFQGFWVAYMGIPGFIVTLAGMLLFRGLTAIVLNSVPVSGLPDAYRDIAGGFVKFSGKDELDYLTLIIFAIACVGFMVQQLMAARAARAYGQTVSSAMLIAKIVVVPAVAMAFAWQLASYRGLPYVLILLAILILVYSTLSQSTVFGRNVYAIGGNKAAARLSGINVKAVSFWVYVHMGFLAAIAGIVFSARVNSAHPMHGNMFELDAIAACFIGGASTTGGVGRISGAMIGALIMAVMTNGMQLLGVETPTQQLIKGAVLLLAVAFDVYNKRRAGSLA